MNDSINIPKWFYIVAVIAIVWNAMGIMAYIQTMTISAEGILKMSEAEQALHNATPSWANGAFAVAVFGGFIGSLLLIFKKPLAFHVLITSLIAILIQMFNAFFIMDSLAVFGPGGLIMPLMIIIIAILLVWLAISMKSKGWIK